MNKDLIRGTLDCVILNKENLYEGDLVRYFQIIFDGAPNVNLPYHNFRHMMHVTWLCYKACEYYKDELSKREMRNLLVAAMFHDYNHQGVEGEDWKNIDFALKGLKTYLLPEDQSYYNDIAYLIKVTQFPYKKTGDKLTLSAKVIRDADLGQALNPIWFQQVIFGLSLEWNKAPMEILEGQNQFHKSLNFYTDWAKDRWPKKSLEAKIDEVNQFLEILKMKR